MLYSTSPHVCALAVRRAVAGLQTSGAIGDIPIMPVAAISVGLVDGRPLLDLDYEEDSTAEVDGNFVMTGDGRFIEIQCTAERRPLNNDEYEALAGLAAKGINDLLILWQEEV